MSRFQPRSQWAKRLAAWGSLQDGRTDRFIESRWIPIVAIVLGVFAIERGAHGVVLAVAAVGVGLGIIGLARQLIHRG